MSTTQERWSLPAERRIALAAGLFAIAVFGAAWALLHRGFYRRDQIIDTPVYQRYGDAMLDGQVPYLDFRVEYPPAALPSSSYRRLAIGTTQPSIGGTSSG